MDDGGFPEEVLLDTEIGGEVSEEEFRPEVNVEENVTEEFSPEIETVTAEPRVELMPEDKICEDDDDKNNQGTTNFVGVSSTRGQEDMLEQIRVVLFSPSSTPVTIGQSPHLTPGHQ